MEEQAQPIILYDGVCGLCNRLNQFVLRRDRSATFRFAALQSPLARDILQRHGADPDALDTFFVVTDCGTDEERLRNRASAMLFVLKTLGGVWRLFTAFGILPTFVLNLGYRLVARNRYKLFGKYDQCLLPPEEWKDRFLA